MEKALILLVDDNPQNLQVLGNLLEGTYRTAFARNDREALEFVEKHLPNLILLDVMMPELNGFEVCQHLKSNPHTQAIPVIFLTARNDVADIIKGFEVGGVDYVTKPFRREELLARVKTQVALQVQQHELNGYAAMLEQKNEELQVMNQTVNEKNTRLQELNASKDRFFSIIAHDLRGPLGSLYNLTEILAENIEHYSKERLIRMLTTQRNAARDLLALLENLLTWSRMQRGLIAWSPISFDIGQMIVGNLSLFATHAENKQITMKTLIPPGIWVYADESMVHTVVRNLLSNALKFTPSGGTVTIAVRTDHSAAEVAVADTGIGITTDDLPKLFRLDVKYQRPGTAKEQGTGLGLLLCKEFVERNGGTIRVASEVGHGSTFMFTLPPGVALENRF